MNDKLLLQDIFIYPIKSLGGIRLEEARVEEKGFQYDRRWMLIDKAGRFVSQREFSSLALLQVEIQENGLLVFHKKQAQKSLFIPFDLAKGPDVPVVIWDDQVIGKVVSESVGRWFSDFLGFDVDLVVMPESSQRKVDPRYAVNGESVSFADGMPYLIIGQSSLNELNSRLESHVPMNRFRPNLVFSGGEPYLEDKLRKIRIGSVEFQIVKPCARCVLTTVDQETGEKGKEPLKTLATYRTVNNKVMFGQNVVALSGGCVKIGDELIPM
ncbi:MOSC domain-containing protein [Algoriphagus sp. AK58]|uniref:MOSC domain-containing protein n=1 Tax=Algoriphagus sp. AK58 TaxID=1406877 RepID=UPI00164F469B|nr:MOSC N-terminal beta barrel domain-containing protein [Algoriphagus sp. AK58]MBC6368451.1 MOSC domain-containing protein [Algoriphagus sp. AK58]